MKTIALATLFAVLFAAPATSQDKPGGSSTRDTSATIGRPPYEYHGPDPSLKGPSASDDLRQKALPAGIGICLIGENYAYISNARDADKCDAVLWTNMVMWADSQRKLIDQSALTGADTTAADGSTICRSCTGTCQTVSLPIKDSKYEDVESDGGQSPSECLASIREVCESLPYRHLVDARCGN